MSADLVLILGAGASVPYGFPTGNELRHWVCDMWTYRNGRPLLDDSANNPNANRAIRIFRVLKTLGVEPNSVAIVGRMLAESKLPSIDRLVFHRSDEIGEVARLLISAMLLDCESNDALMNSRANGDWFVALWTSLTAGRKLLADVPTDKLSVFSFNYDRSLEQLLLSACKATYGVDDNEAAAFVSKIPIEHFYGVATQLFELDPSGVPFDCLRQELHTAVEKAEKEIWLIDDHRKRQATAFANARAAFEQAKVVTFLGYGFDEINDASLEIANWLSEIEKHNREHLINLQHAPRIHHIPSGEVTIDPRFSLTKVRHAPKFQCTTMGMYDREVDAALNRMKLKHGSAPGQISPLSKDCYQALREWGTFDLLRS